MNGQVNYPTDAETEQSWLLTDELAEAIVAISKSGRHGFDSRWPKPDGPSNQQALELELGHVIAAIDIMAARGVVDLERIAQSRRDKLASVQRWLHFESNVAAARDVLRNMVESDPGPALETMRKMIADARTEFRDRAASILADADDETRAFADEVAKAIGEISIHDALTALRNFKSGDRPMRQQLVDLNATDQSSS